MKKYLWILAAAFLLQACSKDEEEGPYVPWRPGDDKEETIDLDKATKVMILTEQAKNRIVMIDQPTGKVAWEWTAADSGLSAAEQAWFDLPVLDATTTFPSGSTSAEWGFPPGLA